MCKVLFGVYIQVILYWFCSHILVYWKYICQIYKCEFNIHFIYTGFLYMQMLYLHTWVVFIVQLGLSTYLVIMYTFCSVLSTYLVIFHAFWTRNWNKIILSYLSPLTALEEKKTHVSFIWYVNAASRQSIWLSVKWLPGAYYTLSITKKKIALLLSLAFGRWCFKYL